MVKKESANPPQGEKFTDIQITSEQISDNLEDIEKKALSEVTLLSEKIVQLSLLYQQKIQQGELEQRDITPLKREIKGIKGQIAQLQKDIKAKIKKKGQELAESIKKEAPDEETQEIISDILNGINETQKKIRQQEQAIEEVDKVLNLLATESKAETPTLKPVEAREPEVAKQEPSQPEAPGREEAGEPTQEAAPEQADAGVQESEEVAPEVEAVSEEHVNSRIDRFTGILESTEEGIEDMEKRQELTSNIDENNWSDEDFILVCESAIRDLQELKNNNLKIEEIDRLIVGYEDVIQRIKTLQENIKNAEAPGREGAGEPAQEASPEQTGAGVQESEEAPAPTQEELAEISEAQFNKYNSMLSAADRLADEVLASENGTVEKVIRGQNKSIDKNTVIRQVEKRLTDLNQFAQSDQVQELIDGFQQIIDKLQAARDDQPERAPGAGQAETPESPGSELEEGEGDENMLDKIAEDLVGARDVLEALKRSNGGEIEHEGETWDLDSFIDTYYDKGKSLVDLFEKEEDQETKDRIDQYIEEVTSILEEAEQIQVSEEGQAEEEPEEQAPEEPEAAAPTGEPAPETGAAEASEPEAEELTLDDIEEGLTDIENILTRLGLDEDWPITSPEGITYNNKEDLKNKCLEFIALLNGLPETAERDSLIERYQVLSDRIDREGDKALKYEDIMKQFGVELREREFGDDIRFTAKEGEFKFDRATEEMIDQIIVEIPNATEEEKATFKDSIIDAFNNAIDNEAREIMQKGQTTKVFALSAGVGIAVGFGSALFRMTGASLLAKASLSLTGGLTGGIAGALRGEIMDKYINPQIAKLKGDNEKGFKKARVKAAKKLSQKKNQGLLRVLAMQAIQSQVLVKRMGVDDPSRRGRSLDYFRGEALARINALGLDFEPADKEKAADALAILSQTTTRTDGILTRAIEENSETDTKEKIKAATRGGFMGLAIGISGDIARVASDSPFVPSMVAGAIGGMAMGGTISAQIEKGIRMKEVNKTIKEIKEISHLNEEGKDIRGYAPKLKAYIDSGILNKYPLYKQQAISLLTEALAKPVEETGEEIMGSALTELKDLEKKHIISKKKKLVIGAIGNAIGIASGALIGGAAAMASQYVRLRIAEGERIAQTEYDDTRREAIRKIQEGRAAARPGGPDGSTVVTAPIVNESIFGSRATIDSVAQRFGLNPASLDFDGDKFIDMQDITDAQNQALPGLNLTQPLEADNFSAIQAIHGSNPDLAQQIISDGNVTPEELQIARLPELTAENKLALLRTPASEHSARLALLSKVTDPARLNALRVGGTLDELRTDVGRLNAHEVTIGGRTDTFGEAILESAKASTPETQDLFIKNILGQDTNVTSENRAQLLTRAVRVLSASNMSGADGGGRVTNLVYEGNKIGINSETGEWFAEKGDASRGPAVRSEIQLRQNSLAMRGMPRELAETARFNDAGEAVVNVRGVSGAEYPVTFHKGGDWSAEVAGTELVGDPGATLEDLQTQINAADNPFHGQFEDSEYEGWNIVSEEMPDNPNIKIYYYDSDDAGDLAEVAIARDETTGQIIMRNNSFDGNAAAISDFRDQLADRVAERTEAFQPYQDAGVTREMAARVAGVNIWDEGGLSPQETAKLDILTQIGSTRIEHIMSEIPDRSHLQDAFGLLFEGRINQDILVNKAHIVDLVTQINTPQVGLTDLIERMDVPNLSDEKILDYGRVLAHDNEAGAMRRLLGLESDSRCDLEYRTLGDQEVVVAKTDQGEYEFFTNNKTFTHDPGFWSRERGPITISEASLSRELGDMYGGQFREWEIVGQQPVEKVLQATGTGDNEAFGEPQGRTLDGAELRNRAQLLEKLQGLVPKSQGGTNTSADALQVEPGEKVESYLSRVEAANSNEVIHARAEAPSEAGVDVTGETQADQLLSGLMQYTNTSDPAFTMERATETTLSNLGVTIQGRDIYLAYPQEGNTPYGAVYINNNNQLVFQTPLGEEGVETVITEDTSRDGYDMIAASAPVEAADAGAVTEAWMQDATYTSIEDIQGLQDAGITAEQFADYAAQKLEYTSGEVASLKQDLITSYNQATTGAEPARNLARQIIRDTLRDIHNATSAR